MFQDLADYFYNASASQSQTILTATCFFIGVFLTWLLYLVVCKTFWRSKIHGAETSRPVDHDDDVDERLNDRSLKCKFPDCVRCSRNREILTTAATKLSYYSDVGTDSSDKNRTHLLNALVSDISRSISRVKASEVQNESVDYLLQKKVSSPVVFHLSGLREDETWSKDSFLDLQLLEVNCTKIQREFENLYAQLGREPDVLNNQNVWKQNETNTGRWDIALLVDQGRLTKAANLCPLTMSVLGRIPQVMRDSVFGDVSFSVVHPGTDIPTHCGSTNIRIRCHLGLKVPAGDVCQLRVRDEVCHWKENDILCFNDAHPHSVHHKGGHDSGYRAILMVDLWHPDITEVQRKLLSYAFAV